MKKNCETREMTIHRMKSINLRYLKFPIYFSLTFPMIDEFIFGMFIIEKIFKFIKKILSLFT